MTTRERERAATATAKWRYSSAVMIFGVKTQSRIPDRLARTLKNVCSGSMPRLPKPSSNSSPSPTTSTLNSALVRHQNPLQGIRSIPFEEFNRVDRKRTDFGVICRRFANEFEGFGRGEMRRRRCFGRDPYGYGWAWRAELPCLTDLDVRNRSNLTD